MENLKLSFVSNIQGDVDWLLTRLNRGEDIDKTKVEDTLEKFVPDVDFFEKLWRSEPNTKYFLGEFSVPYLVAGNGYVNYLCDTFTMLVPNGFEKVLEDFSLGHIDASEYTEFVKRNVKRFDNDSDKEIVKAFIESMGRNGKIVLLSHETYVFHQRDDGRCITRKIENPLPRLGSIKQNRMGLYQFQVINSDLEDEIMEMADSKIVLQEGEVKLKLEKRNQGWRKC